MLPLTQWQASELAKPRALSRMGKIYAQILCFSVEPAAQPAFAILLLVVATLRGDAYN